MTPHAWLDARSAAAPPQLARRVEEALAELDGEAVDDVDIPSRCVAAADALLRNLLARPTAGRDCALDLLTVDALVTYAFEAAAERPATLRSLADHAMRRLAATARA